jgi:hypothetical protein
MMLRRKFFGWISSSLVPFVFPQWARAQEVALAESDVPMLNEVAVAVLPGSLGRGRALEIASHFEKWIKEYHAGADAGYGYGHPRVRVLGPNPAMHYGEHLRKLDAAARAKGGSFGTLDEAVKRALVTASLTAAAVTSIPPRPNGKHVVTDLMSFFYNSSAGEDFLYNARISREDCRGLPSSGKRPVPVS